MAIDKLNSVDGFSVGVPPTTVIDGNANVTANNASVTGNLSYTGPNAQLGNVSNLHITGGNSGQALVTDGTGNLRWGNVSNPADANTAVQYNLNGSFGGNAAAFSYTDSTTTLAVTSAQWQTTTAATATAISAVTAGTPGAGTIVAEQWVAVDAGNGSANSLIRYAAVTSSGAAVWQQVDAQVSAGSRLLAIAQGQGSFLAVGENGRATRSNTLTGPWDSAINTTVASTLAGVAYSPDDSAWIIVGSSGVIRRSTDGGASWGAVTATVTADLLAVTWSQGLFVAVGTQGTVVYSSDGGLSWTTEQVAGQQQSQFNAVAYDNNNFNIVAVTEQGTVVIKNTVTGLTEWRQITDQSLTDIVLADQVFVAADSAGQAWVALVTAPTEWFQQSTLQTGTLSLTASSTGSVLVINSTGSASVRLSARAASVVADRVSAATLTVTDTVALPEPQFITIPGGTTTQAQLQIAALTATGAISAVTVTNAGAGYDYTPTVTVTGANTSPARITVTISGGAVSTVDIVEAGLGYSLATAAATVSEARKYLATDGQGHLTWLQASGGQGSGGSEPGGNNGEFQFNRAGALGGSSALVYDAANTQVTVAGNLVIAGGNTGTFLKNTNNGRAQWANSTVEIVVANTYQNITVPDANTVLVTSTLTAANSTSFTANASLYSYANTAYTVLSARSAGAGNFLVSGNAAAFFSDLQTANTRIRVGQLGETHSVAGATYNLGANNTLVTLASPATFIDNVAAAAVIYTQGPSVIDSGSLIAFDSQGQQFTVTTVSEYDLATSQSTVAFAPAVSTAVAANTAVYVVADSAAQAVTRLRLAEGIDASIANAVVDLSVTTSRISNGSSAVSIAEANGAVTVTANGNSNVITVTANAVNSLTTINGDLSVGGNLTVTGNTNYINLNQLSISDPILDIGTGNSGEPLRFQDGFDRGQAYHFYNANLIQTTVASNFAANVTTVQLAANTAWANISIGAEFAVTTANSDPVFPGNTLISNVDQANTRVTVTRASQIAGTAGDAALIGRDLLNFAGYDYSTNLFVFASNVTISNNTVSWANTALGNIQANRVLANTIENNRARVTVAGTGNTGRSAMGISGVLGNVEISGNSANQYSRAAILATETAISTVTFSNSLPVDTLVATVSGNTLALAANSVLAFTGGSNSAYQVRLVASTSSNFAANYQLILPVNAGNAQQYLQTDGNGRLSWQTVVQSAADTSNAVQFNANSAFAGDAGRFRYSPVTQELVVQGTAWQNTAELTAVGTVSAVSRGITANSLAALSWLAANSQALVSTANTSNLAAWTTVDTLATAQQYSVVATDTAIVTVGARGTVSATTLRSTDAVTWSQQEISGSTITGDLLAAVFTAVPAANTLVAVGEVGLVATSTDLGLTWSLTSANTAETLTAVATTATTILAAGTAGTVSVSTDAAAWQAETVSGLTAENFVAAAAITATDFMMVTESGWAAVRTAANTYATVRVTDTETLQAVAVAGSGHIIVTGSAGTSWLSPVASPLEFTELATTSSADITAVTAAANTFVAFDSTGTVLTAAASTGSIRSDAVSAGVLTAQYGADLGSVTDITITGGAVTPAVLGAVTLDANGAVTAIAITSGGSGYDQAPQVTVTGANSEQALVTAELTLDSVTNIVVTRAGRGYAAAGAGSVGTVLTDPVKFLRTDGAGNLSWQSVAQGTGTGTAETAGSNREIQFNDSGILGASAVFEFDKSANTVSVLAAANAASNSVFSAGSFTVNVAANAANSTVSLGAANRLFISGGNAGEVLTSNNGSAVTWSRPSVQAISATTVGMANTANAFTVVANTAANANIVTVASLDTAANILALFPIDTLVTFDLTAFYRITDIDIITADYEANITLATGLAEEVTEGTALRRAVTAPTTTLFAANNIVANISNSTGLFTVTAVASGNTTEIQFNSNGRFAGSNLFTYDGTNSVFAVTGSQDITGTLTVLADSNTLASGRIVAGALDVTVEANAANNLVVLGQTRLSSTLLAPNVSNVRITGGNTNQVLTTDGAANLTWANARLYGGNLYNWLDSGLELAANYTGSNNPGGLFYVAGDQLRYDNTGASVTNIDIANSEFTVSGDQSSTLDSRAVRFNSSTGPVVNINTATYDGANDVTVCTLYTALGGSITDVVANAAVYAVTGGPVTLPATANISFANGSTDTGLYNSFNSYFDITANRTTLGFAVTGNTYIQPTGNYAANSSVYQAVYTGYTYYDHILAGTGISLAYDQANSAVTVNGQNGSELRNGNSNVVIDANANIRFSSNGQADILQITSNGTHATSVFEDDVVVTGNLNVTGNTNYFNINRLTISNPLIDIATGPNGAPLTANDAYDRGQLYHFYNPNLTQTTIAANFSSGATVITVANAAGVTPGQSLFANNIAEVALFPGNTVVANVDLANSQITASEAATTGGNIGDAVAIGVDQLSFAGLDQSTGLFTFAPNVTVTNNIVTYNNGLGGLAAASLLANNVSSNAQLTLGAGLNSNYVANVVTVANTGITLRGNNHQLGSAANIKITGGSNGQFLRTDGAGNLTWDQASTQWAGLTLSDFTVLNPANANTNTMLVTSANLSANSAVGFRVGTTFSIARISGNTVYTVTAITPEPVPLQYRGTVDFTPALDNSLTAAQQIYTGNLPQFTKLTTGPNITGVYTAANSTVTLDTTGFANGTSNIRIAANSNITFSAAGNSNVVTVRGNGLVLSGSNNFLGPVGNLRITGGSANQFLQTDGTGRLTWANAAGASNYIPAIQWVIGTTAANQVLSNSFLGLYTDSTELVVFRNGVLMDLSDYTLSGQSLTVTRLLVAGDNIDVLRQATTFVSGPVYTMDYSAVQPIHFDVVAAGNNQSFTDAQIAFYAANTDMTVFLNGAYLSPQYYTKANATITVTLPLNAQDSLDIAGKIANVANLDVSVAGSNQQVQFNNAGVFGASAQFTFDSDLEQLSVTNISATDITGNLVVADQVSVTDAAGNITGFAAAANVTEANLVFILPDRQGAAGQTMVNDGNGALQWGFAISDAISNGTSNIRANVSNGNITVSVANTVNVAHFTSAGLTANTVAANTLQLAANSYQVTVTANTATANNYSLVLPVDAGVANQVLRTDGAGNLSWLTISPNSLVNGNSNVVVEANANITVSSNGIANILTVTAANGGNTTVTGITVAGRGNFTGAVTATEFRGALANGNSNIVIYANANVAVSSNGVANVAQISATGMAITGTLTVTGNTTGPNFVGNVVKGNSGFKITSSNSNVAVVSDSYVWDFNEFGETTFPDNTLNAGINPLTVYADGNIGFGTNGVNNMIRIHAVASANSDITFFTEATPLMFWNTGGAPYIGTGANGTRPRLVLSESEFQITNNNLSRGLVINNEAVVTIESDDESTSANANVGAFRVFGGASIEKNVHVGGTVAAANLTLRNAAGNTLVLLPAANISSNFSLRLPNTVGANTQILQSDGAGNIQWANFQLTSIQNGNSNVVVDANAAIRISSNGQANILVVSSNGTLATTTVQDNMTVTGNFAVTANGNVLVVEANRVTLGQATTVQSTLTVDDDLFVAGNLTVAGNAIYANTEILTVEDPLIQLGVGQNNTPLTSATLEDRGLVMHSYGAGASKLSSANVSSGELVIPIANTVGLTAGMLVGVPSNTGLIPTGTVIDTVNANSNIVLSAAVTGNIAAGTEFNIGTDLLRFIGWDTSQARFVAASNVTVTNEIVAYNTLGDFVANSFETASNGVLRLQANSFFTTVAANTSLTANTQFVLPVNNGSNTQILQSDGNGITRWANFTPTSLVNGNSNVVVDANADIRISSNGIANVLTVTASDGGNVETTGASLTGFFTATGNITAANFTGVFANGNSNVSIPAANGNVNISAAGNANVLVVTGTGANISGTANISGNTSISANLTVTSNVTATNFVGNLANANSGVRISGANGNITVTAAANSWQFTTDGDIIPPANAISSPNSLALQAYGSANGAAGISWTRSPSNNTLGVINSTGITANGADGLTLATFGGDGSNIVGSSARINITLDSAGSYANVLANNFNVTASNTTLTTALLVSGTSNLNGNVTGTNANFSGNVTAANFVGVFANGNSNISIPAANGNINFSAEGNANVLVITGTGANISGTANITGTANISGNTSISANLAVTGNITAGNIIGALANGNSNIRILENSNVLVSANGIANIVTVAATANTIGVILAGNIQAYNLNVTGNTPQQAGAAGGSTVITGSDGAAGDSANLVAAGPGGSITVTAGSGGTDSLDPINYSGAAGNVSITAGNTASPSIQAGNITLQSGTGQGANYNGNIGFIAGSTEWRISGNDGQLISLGSNVNIAVTGTVIANTVQANGNISAAANITANNFVGRLANGNSNIVIAANSTVTVTANGNSVVTVASSGDGNLTTTGMTVAGYVYSNANVTASGITLYDANGNTMSLVANANTTGNYTLVLPFDDGVPGTVLMSDGFGNLTWSAPVATGLANGTTTMTAANSGNITVNIANISNVAAFVGQGNSNVEQNGLVVEGFVAANLVRLEGNGEITTVRANSAQTSSFDFVLPATPGTSGYVLTTDGAGNTSWQVGGAGSALNVLSGGNSNSNAYASLANVGESTIVMFDNDSDPLSADLAAGDIIIFQNDTSNSYRIVAITSPSGNSANVQITPNLAVAISSTVYANKANVSAATRMYAGDNITFNYSDPAIIVSANTSNIGLVENLVLQSNSTGNIANAGTGESLVFNGTNWTFNSVLRYQVGVRLATATALSGTPAYNNGTSGVGATLTATANGALSIDSVAVANTNRVIVKDQSTAAHNGVYLVTDTGNATAPYILTRTTDYDTSTEILGKDVFFVSEGSVNGGATLIQLNSVSTVGTDAFEFQGGGVNTLQSVTQGGNSTTFGITINNTAVSTTSLTGALVVGNTGNAQLSTAIGSGNVNVGDTITARSAVLGNVSANSTVTVLSNVNSTAANTGALIISGNVSNATISTAIGNGNIRTGGNITAANAVFNRGNEFGTNFTDEFLKVGSNSAGTPANAVIIGINTNTSTPGGVRISKGGFERWFLGTDNTSSNGNFVVNGPTGTLATFVSDGSVITFNANVTANGNLAATNAVFARNSLLLTAATDEYVKIGANTSGNAANPVVLGINSSNSTFSGIRISKQGTERWFFGADNSQATGNLVVNGPGGTYMRMVNSDNTTANAYVVTVQNRSINMRRTAANVANATNYQITWDITDNYNIPNLTHANGIFTNTGAPRKFRFDFQNSSLATGASAVVIEGDMWFQYNAPNTASLTNRYGQQATQNTNRVNWIMSTSWTFLMNTNDTVTCWTWTNNSTGGNVTIGEGGFGQGANYTCRLTVTEVL